MNRLPARLGPRAFGFSAKWFWGLAAVIAAIILLFLVFSLPRLTAVYEMYWSRSNIQKLFYEDLGLSQSWSSFIAVVGSFIYALAWVPLSFWLYRVLVWKFNASQLSLAFICWVFVYGHVPLLHALLGTDICFNQKTGEPTKWYVQDPDGRIVLFDSGGFDAATGAQKTLVTSQICNAFQRQKKNDRPRRITVDARQVEFFDPTTGRPRVWYSRTSEGAIELFDSPGYDPVTSETLLPVSRDLVTEIINRLADEEAARKRAEVERRQAEADAEAVRKQAEQVRIQAEAEARQQAEQERIRAQDEAQKRAEQERIRSEAEAQRQAERDRVRAAIAARKQAEQVRIQAEAEARQQAEQERIRAAAEAQKQAEQKRILDSYVNKNGVMCHTIVNTETGNATCNCGSFYTAGPC
ncbi:MAG: cell envelope integrity protein TolA [Roseiarcus sp.]